VRDTAAMENPTLHTDCAALAFLLGRWEGTGRGLWTAETPFRYREEVVIDHAGKPFLRYAQRTRAEDDDRHVKGTAMKPLGCGEASRARL
jgi:hypothetical protein